MTTTTILAILLILAVILDIALVIRVVVLRNYLSLMERRIGEIEASLSPKNKKSTTHGLKTRGFEETP